MRFNMPYKKIDPHEEETIRKMPISELKQVCDQPMSGDFKEADLAIMRCRILASRLRHEHCYEEAKIYYRKAIIDIKKILGSLVEAEENLSELDHQIFLLETSMDLGLTLFEQELYDECLDQLQMVQPDIEKISEAHKNNKKIIVALRHFFLLNAEVYLQRQSIEEANQFLEKYEGLGDEHITEEMKVRFQTVKGNIEAHKENHVEALKCYQTACITSFNLIKAKTIRSRGGLSRFFHCAINLARAYDKDKNYQAGIKCLETAIKANDKLKKIIAGDDPLICRLHLEIARLFELDNNLDKAIEHVEKVNTVHKKNIKKEKFHPFDLLQTLSMINRLAHWYAKKDDLLKAGKSFMDMAEVLKTDYPYQKLHCFNQALFYFQTLHDDDKDERLAITLSHLAKAYCDLPCPDYINALCMIKNAISLRETPERTSLATEIQGEYDKYFCGWPAESVIQWSWCLHNLSDFQQNWANSSLHCDDFFHWQTFRLTLSPERRVQLMMLLSRLYCLLDHSYNYFVRKTIPTNEKTRNLYFPVKLSEYALENEWKIGQKVWERTVKNAGGESTICGFGQPEFEKIRDAITKLQPFTSMDSWLFNLGVLYNYSKHVHIGVQQLPPHYLEKRCGLIKRCFTDIQIGLTRMSDEVYPLSFNHLLDNKKTSQEVYFRLVKQGLLKLKDSSDTNVAHIVEIDAVSRYLDAMKNEAGDTQSVEACDQYTNIIFETLKDTSLNQSHAKQLADFLLNLKAQSKGLEEPQYQIEATPFVQSSFNGTAELLTNFSGNQAIIRCEEQPATLAVEELTDTDANTVSPLDIFFLAKEYNKFFEIIFEYKSRVSLYCIRNYHKAAFGVLSFFLAHHVMEGIQKLLNEVNSVLPFCFVKRYLDQLKKWQPGEVGLIEQYAKIVEIPVFPVEIETRCIDDDLLERIKSIHQSIYYDLPFYLFLQDNHAKLMRINMSVDAYLQIIFILDQSIQRYLSRALGEVKLIAFPGDKKSLDQIAKMLGTKGYSLDPRLLTQIKDSFTWFKEFRLIQLKAKHANIKDLLTLASGGFGSKSFTLHHLEPHRLDYSHTKCNISGVELLQKLKTALDFARSIVLGISQAMLALPNEPVLYNHLKKLKQAEKELPRHFSAAAAQQSALRSNTLFNSSRSSGFIDGISPRDQGGGGSKNI